MGTGRRTWIVQVLFLCSIAGTARGEEVVDAKVGYSFTLSEGWRRIPDETLARKLAGMAGAGAPRFAAAYEPGGRQAHLRYPYLLVQVQSYGPGVELSTVSRRELHDVVAQLSAGLTGRSKQGRPAAVGGVSFETPMVFTNPPGVAVELKMKVAGVGVVHGRTMGRLGRTNAVFLHFYAKDRDWVGQWDLLDELDASFRRTPEQSITVGDATRTASGAVVSPGGGFDWSRAGRGGIFGGIAGAVIGVIALLACGRKNAGTDA